MSGAGEELVAEVEVELAEPLTVGAVAGGTRIVYPIVGGVVRGPSLHGRVLPIGADFATLLTPSTRDALDGVEAYDVSARYLLELEDGSLVEVHNEGRVRFVGDREEAEGTTEPRFTADAGGAHAWLNTAGIHGTLRLGRREGDLDRSVVVTFFGPCRPA